jgi:hypothetical protein
MKVRNKLLSKKEYKGRLTEASDKMCPCRPCWNPHDCGYKNSAGKRIVDMYCLTNYSDGCPIRIGIVSRKGELVMPVHILRSNWHRKKGQIRTCLRCGQRVVIGEINFIPFETDLNHVDFITFKNVK